MSRDKACGIQWPRVNSEAVEQFNAVPIAFETGYSPFDSTAAAPICFQGVSNDCIRPFITAGSEEDQILASHGNNTIKGTSDYKITSTAGTSQGILHIGGMKKFCILHLDHIKASGREAQGICDRVVIVEETNEICPFKDG